MEQSETPSLSPEDSFIMIRLIHSVQALIPAMGNPAVHLDMSAEQSPADADTPAKQAAVSTVPALGDSSDTQKKAERSNQKSASGIFKWLKLLLVSSSGVTVIGAQTFCLITIIEYFKNSINEFIRKRKSEQLMAAVKGTNPNYAPGEQNKKWRINCQRCVSVFEARMRGQKVTARPNPHLAHPTLDDLSHPNAESGIYSVYKSPDILDMSSANEWDCEQKIRKQMEEWGEGSRAIVTVYWKGGGGHVFNAVQINGQTEYVDPQTGNMFCLSYFNDVDTSKKICLTRTDNQEFTNRLNLCTQEEPKGE